MAHIFLSYDSHDRGIARQIVSQLEANGWSVWWDRRIQAGKPWRAALDRALREMDCMVVLWSGQSIESDWVIEEAEEGRARGKLLPVLIEDVVAPRGFRQIQALSFVDWDGSAQASCFRTLLHDLAAISAEAGRSTRGANRADEAGDGAEARAKHDESKRPVDTQANDSEGTARAAKSDARTVNPPRRSKGIAGKLVAAIGAVVVAALLLPALGVIDARTTGHVPEPYLRRGTDYSRYDEKSSLPVRSYDDAVTSSRNTQPAGPTQTMRMWRERSYEAERGWDRDSRWRIESDRGDGRRLSDEQVRSALIAMERMGLLSDDLRRMSADRSWTPSQIESARGQLEASRAAKRQIESMGR
jgi:hypothetical protein